MATNASRDELFAFLDYLGEKGLMARATAQARKAAASAVLAVLDQEEAQDITKVDLDHVMTRFVNIHGKKYSTGSLNTYKSRVRSALDDFSSYLKNPLGFRPGVQRRERNTSKTPRARPEQDATIAEPRQESVRTAAPPMAASDIIPIRIRENLIVYIQGLPFDLTEAEARKVAGVVTAMAQSA